MQKSPFLLVKAPFFNYLTHSIGLAGLALTLRKPTNLPVQLLIIHILFVYIIISAHHPATRRFVFKGPIFCQSKLNFGSRNHLPSYSNPLLFPIHSIIIHSFIYSAHKVTNSMMLPTAFAQLNFTWISLLPLTIAQYYLFTLKEIVFLLNCAQVPFNYFS